MGLAFAAYFLRDFSIKMFFQWYSIYGQSCSAKPFFLLEISNKMCYWVKIHFRQGEKEGRTEIEKFDYLEHEKSFFDEIKSIFHSFWRVIIWWKNKNLIKITDASFNHGIGPPGRSSMILPIVYVPRSPYYAKWKEFVVLSELQVLRMSLYKVLGYTLQFSIFTILFQKCFFFLCFSIICLRRIVILMSKNKTDSNNNQQFF